LILVAACGFEVPAQFDAAPPIDDMQMPDVPIDTPTPRVTTGLIGFWTFNDAPGTRFLADTSGSSMPVALEVETNAELVAPELTGGNLIANNFGRIHSAINSHLAMDCMNAAGVTFEIWAKPTTAVEGSSGAPAFVAGLAANIVSRNVAILHAGDKWLAQVRTSSAMDGSPNMLSTAAVSSTSLTHLVVVASATKRAFYVNGIENVSTMPGAPFNWDSSYPLALLDEYQHARLWTGTLSLVAMFNRALTPAEITQNFMAGPDAP
jgi:hypothetical protein